MLAKIIALLLLLILGGTLTYTFITRVVTPLRKPPS